MNGKRVKFTHTPGLMCGIEAHKNRGVDLRVLQAEIQLTGYKRSLNVAEIQIYTY